MAEETGGGTGLMRRGREPVLMLALIKLLGGLLITAGIYLAYRAGWR